MKPRYYILIAVSLFSLLIAAFILMRPGSNQRRLTLLEFGEPQALIPITEAVTGIPRRTDEYGTITYPLDDTTARSVFVVHAGKWREIPVPDKGHAIVNFYNRYSIRKTIVYEPGSWFPKEETTEEFYFADTDLAAIKAKKFTREFAEDYYRKQAQAYIEARK